MRRKEGFKTGDYAAAGRGGLRLARDSAAMRRRLLASTAAPTNSSKRCRPSARQRFIPEQHRDAALDAGPEALAFFEGWAFLERFAFGGFLSAPLGDGDDLDAGLLAGREVVVGAVKTAVASIDFRGLTKGLLMVLERRFDRCSSAGFPSSTRY